MFAKRFAKCLENGGEDGGEKGGEGSAVLLSGQRRTVEPQGGKLYTGIGLVRCLLRFSSERCGCIVLGQTSHQ
jgi:hypothetical protein